MIRFEVFVWSMYAFLCLLILLDWITTYIGLQTPGIYETNPLVRYSYLLNLGCQVFILIMFAVITHYVIVVSNNIALMR